MKKRMLDINEVDVTNAPVVYTCYGLGSCIGLFITDRMKKISGGAHIPLPSEGAGQLLDASSLINQLLESFRSQGSSLQSLRAKVTGGANVLETSVNIGEQNAKVVLQKLTERKIFVAATDVGGRVSRTARFNSVTGELQISTSERKMYCI